MATKWIASATFGGVHRMAAVLELAPAFHLGEDQKKTLFMQQFKMAICLFGTLLIPTAPLRA
jgi:hypothetical protein